MKKQNLWDEFCKAKEGGYAVPAFNFNDVWDMGGVIAAAEELRSPIIVETVKRVMNAAGREAIVSMAKAACEAASVPAFLHLDHCDDVQYCKECVDLGFDMVMIDASKLPLEENIKAVREVVDYAHSKGVLVEGEIGQVKNNSNASEEGTFEGGPDDGIVVLDDAIKFVKETNVDILAVGIGTAHGFYKGKPNIRFDRLKECNDALDMPLVLHGGTGIPADDIHKALKLGICKMNIGAQIRFAYITKLKEILADAEPTAHPLDIHFEAKKNIIEYAKVAIKNQYADGKAE